MGSIKDRKGRDLTEAEDIINLCFKLNSAAAVAATEFGDKIFMKGEEAIKL